MSEMGFTEYQNEVLRTAGNVAGDLPGLSMSSLGMAGEAGEVLDLMVQQTSRLMGAAVLAVKVAGMVDGLKKVLFHGHTADKPKVKKELGDVLWYLTLACHQHGFELVDVARDNVLKLRARYPEGWDPKRSQNRESST